MEHDLEQPSAGRHRLLDIAARLSDLQLLRQVTLLAAHEREATAELVAHLAEVDVRKLHLADGYGSLFAYCTGALHLAEHAAYNRIEAARLCRAFPAVLDLLSDGSLNLSTLRLLGPHLQPENFETLVAEARGRSKREVERLVARLAPRPDLAASVRKLPRPTSEARTVAPAEVEPATQPAASLRLSAASPQISSAGATDLPAASPSPAPAPAEPAASDLRSASPHASAGAAPDGADITAATAARRADRGLVSPLASERYRVQFTIDQAAHDMLRQLQDLLRREIPGGDPGAIFSRALPLLLEEVARKKLAATVSPRPAPGTQAGSRHVPARVKRAVWLRDRGRCAFVARSGRRCGERAFLEFHHREPYAIGGEATSANIALRCRAHNVYEAELLFGARAAPRAAVVPGPAA